MSIEVITKYKNKHCPNCGELKVNSHKLQNGTFGVWCDNCLEGIPTRTLHARSNEQQAWEDYEFFKNFYYRKRTK